MPAAVSAVWLTSAWNTGIACPHTAALTITGDIDVRIKLSLPVWGQNANLGLVSKRQTSGQWSWRMNYGWQGELRIQTYADGTTARTFQTGVGAGNIPSWIATPNAVGWLRVTLDVDNGSGGATARFYESTDGTAWTLYRTITTAGIASIFAGTDPIIIGADGDNGFVGKIYAAEVRNGIDGPVVASWKALGSLDKYRDPQGNIWTVTTTNAAVAEG